MSENVSDNSFDLNNTDVVDTVLGDAELRKLPVGSDAFKAALSEKMSKTDENHDAPAGDEESDQMSEDDVDEDDKSEDSDEQQEPNQKKAKRGMLKRIEELVSEREAERRRATELEARLAAYEQKSKPEQEEASEGKFDKAKPKMEHFDSIEDYYDALTDWKLEKRDFEEQQANFVREAQEREKQIADTWESRESEVKKELRDYDSVVTVEAFKSSNPSVDAQVFLSESEYGPKVLYELFSDEDLTDEFANASSVRQVALLSKIEARLESSKPTEKTTTISKAPTPPKSLAKGRASSTVKDINDPNLTFAEFDQLMRERERANKRK